MKPLHTALLGTCCMGGGGEEWKGGGEGQATARKKHAPLTGVSCRMLGLGGSGRGALLLGLWSLPRLAPHWPPALLAFLPISFCRQGHPCPPACPSGSVHQGPSCPRATHQAPWLSGCQFLDGSVVVLRDGGRQRVPAVGVELDDLQQQGPGQHRLRGAQHLVAGTGQELRHHLGQLLLQQSACALQLRAEKWG